MKPQTFPISAVLSITTGLLLCDASGERPMDGVYRILNFITGENLFTHQLPRAAEQAKPDLIRQYPWLDSGDVHFRVATLQEMLQTPSGKSDPEKLILGWLSQFTLAYPAELALFPLPLDDRAPQDAVAELEAMVGKDRVVVVRPPEAA